MARRLNRRSWLAWIALAAASFLASCDRPMENLSKGGNRNAHEATDEAAASNETSADEFGDIAVESRPLFARFRQAMEVQDYENAANQLARIAEREPNNIAFGEFHAHHLGYNIAAEMAGDPAAVYRWKRRAVLVLIEGLDRNPESAGFCAGLSWFTGFGVGRNDDAKGLRQRFALDDGLHQRLAVHVDLAATAGPDGKPANFLVAKLLAAKAVAIFERNGQFPENAPPLLLYSRLPMCQVWHAYALRDDGYAGRANAAWKQARQMFISLEQQEIPHDDGRIRMADDAELIERLVMLGERLDALRPGLRQRVTADVTFGRETLNSIDQGLLLRARQQGLDASVSKAIIAFGNEQLANELKSPHDAFALELAQEADVCYKQLAQILRNRIIINLDDWLLRCEIEQDQSISRTWELLRLADEAYLANRLDDESAERPGARQAYQQAFALLADAQAKNPRWADCNTFWRDLEDLIKVAKERYGEAIVPASLQQNP